MSITSPISIPVTGEKGKTFFPKLEAYGTRINSHIHDGINSEKIKFSDLLRTGTEGLNQTIDVTLNISAGGYQDIDLTTYVNLNAQKSLIQLRQVTGDYEVVNLKITTPNVNTIRITSSIAINEAFRVIVRGE